MFVQLEDVATDDHHQSCGFALLSAQLAAFLDGIELGDIDHSSAQALRDVFEGLLRARGLLDPSGVRGAAPLPGDALWNAFRAALTTVADSAHPKRGLIHGLADTRDPNPAFAAGPFVSLGPIHYHAAKIRHGAALLGDRNYVSTDEDEILLMARDLDWLAQCAVCLTAALDDGAFDADYLKGRAEYVVWLAPEQGRVDYLATQRSGSRLASAATDRLRDLLGLWAEDGHGQRPLAMFRLEASPLYAPNVISAAGYERFRHRSGRYRRGAPTAGLTYNLDPAVRAAQPGSSEVIAVGVTMATVREAIACGTPSAIDKRPPQLLAAHKDYAKQVCRRRSWKTILRRLEDALK